jgi:K+-transporting ATPase KdpF subunit
LWRFFSLARSTFVSARSCRRIAMETIVVGIIAALLFVYLFVAMIRPEKF